MNTITTRHPRVDELAPVRSGHVQVRGARAGNGKSSDSRAVSLDLASQAPVLYVHTDSDQSSWDIIRQMAALGTGLNATVLNNVELVLTTDFAEVRSRVAELAARRGSPVAVVIDYIDTLGRSDGASHSELNAKQAGLLTALASQGHAVLAYTQANKLAGAHSTTGVVTSPADLRNQLVVAVASTLVILDRFRPFANPAVRVEVRGSDGRTRTKLKLTDTGGTWRVHVDGTRYDVPVNFDVDPLQYRGHWVSV